MKLLHPKDCRFDIRFLEAQILNSRIDVPMAQCFLRPKNIFAEGFIDPVRESLPHSMRGNFTREFVSLNDFF